MKRISLLLCALAVAEISFAQDPTEIYLFDLSIKKEKVSISNPVNISDHKGYDNQPSFHPAQPAVFFSSAADDGRTDIFSYDYKKKVKKSITQTQEREYSPTVTLDQQSLSCIIQRENGAQDLGKYPIEGGEPMVIIDKLTVGYHVWADNSHLGLFILGTKEKPVNTLHYLLLPMKRDTILAENIGRSLHKIPGETAFSFVHKISDKEWLIKKFNSQTQAISTITSTLPGRDDLAWLPDGKIIMSDGTKLFFSQPDRGTTWSEVVVSGGAEVLRSVTRIAVSADGKKLAVVVAE
ncbi:MAG: hypothetical protein WDN75_02515 [Bacteroidota bacterium]